MKLTLILILVSVIIISAVQAEVISTENQSSPSNVSTSNTDSTLAWSGPVNITEPTPGTKWEVGSLHAIHWTLMDNNSTDGNSTDGGRQPGNNSTEGNPGHGNGTENGDDNGDGHRNDTETDHLSIQLAVGGNVQAVDLIFPLAHNVSKSDGTAQILVPQHITGGKNFTLAVGQPDQGVSLVTGIDIEDNNNNGTHDKNDSVNPDYSNSMT